MRLLLMLLCVMDFSSLVRGSSVKIHSGLAHIGSGESIGWIPIKGKGRHFVWTISFAVKPRPPGDVDGCPPYIKLTARCPATDDVSITFPKGNLTGTLHLLREVPVEDLSLSTENLAHCAHWVETSLEHNTLSDEVRQEATELLGYGLSEFAFIMSEAVFAVPGEMWVLSRVELGLVQKRHQCMYDTGVELSRGVAVVVCNHTHVGAVDFAYGELIGIPVGRRVDPDHRRLVVQTEYRCAYKASIRTFYRKIEGTSEGQEAAFIVGAEANALPGIPINIPGSNEILAARDITSTVGNPKKPYAQITTTKTDIFLLQMEFSVGLSSECDDTSYVLFTLEGASEQVAVTLAVERHDGSIILPINRLFLGRGRNLVAVFTAENPSCLLYAYITTSYYGVSATPQNITSDAFEIGEGRSAESGQISFTHIPRPGTLIASRAFIAEENPGDCHFRGDLSGRSISYILGGEASCGRTEGWTALNRALVLGCPNCRSLQLIWHKNRCKRMMRVTYEVYTLEGTTDVIVSSWDTMVGTRLQMDPTPTEIPTLMPTLGVTPLSEAPLSETPLSEIPLSETPLSETPLNETPSPLSATPLSETPLSVTPTETLTDAPGSTLPEVEATTASPPTEPPRSDAPVISLPWEGGSAAPSFSPPSAPPSSPDTAQPLGVPSVSPAPLATDPPLAMTEASSEADLPAGAQAVLRFVATPGRSVWLAASLVDAGCGREEKIIPAAILVQTAAADAVQVLNVGDTVEVECAEEVLVQNIDRVCAVHVELSEQSVDQGVSAENGSDVAVVVAEVCSGLLLVICIVAFVCVVRRRWRRRGACHRHEERLCQDCEDTESKESEMGQFVVNEVEDVAEVVDVVDVSEEVDVVVVEDEVRTVDKPAGLETVFDLHTGGGSYQVLDAEQNGGEQIEDIPILH